MTVTYKNGDFGIIIKNDGTKIRYGSGKAVFPESIDLKVTDYCEVGCPFCHESSTKRGIHADCNFIYDILKQMERGTEVAIGGGNPLDYPDLQKILLYAKAKGLFANLTVNSQSLEYYIIKELFDRKLINGLGISIHEKDKYLDNDIIYRLYAKYPTNIVFHCIAGIHDYFCFDAIFNNFYLPKILILGYKTYGFGAKKSKNIDYYIEHLKENLEEWKDKHISFDNLACQQLDIKNLFPEEYNRSFMGEDGKHTMYVDAVTQSFSVNSTGDRISFGKMSLNEAFHYGR